MTQSADEILANLRRARQAVRGGADKASAQRPSTVIVPLPEVMQRRGGRSEDSASEPVLRRPPSVRAIIAAVATAYGVSPLDIVSHRRPGGIILPRQLVMYLARYFTTLSYPEIGDRLHRDHSTVLFGVRAIAARLADKPEIKVDRTTTLTELVAAHRSALENK